MKLIDDLVVKLHQKKVGYLTALIEEWVDKKGKIMDLGCGSGEISLWLIGHGYEVTSVDVVAKVKVVGVKEILYDGEHLPFKDKEFDQVLLITVLHHVPKYKELLQEVARVSREVIIVEDVPESWLDWLGIWFWDGLLNLELWGHPHNNQDDLGWKKRLRSWVGS